MKVGLVIHAGRDASIAAAADAARHLTELGVDVVIGGEDAPAGIDAETASPDAFPAGLDLAISFGGDGTFLRAAHLCRDAGVPVLGVNLGRLGFLAEVEVDDLAAALAVVARGAFTTEERGTLEIEVRDAAGTILERGWALNEVSIEKTARQRLLLMDVHVGDTLFAKVPADALVVATATGSTAYALSAGGPILSPQVEATLVVPVAPHSLFDRTLVAGPHERIHVHVLPEQEAAVVSADGREPVTVQAGGSVVAVGGGRPVLLATLDRVDFYTKVRRKFGLH